jgi:hypothetical protein
VKKSQICGKQHPLDPILGKIRNARSIPNIILSILVQKSRKLVRSGQICKNDLLRTGIWAGDLKFTSLWLPKIPLWIKFLFIQAYFEDRLFVSRKYLFWNRKYGLWGSVWTYLTGLSSPTPASLCSLLQKNAPGPMSFGLWRIPPTGAAF